MSGSISTRTRLVLLIMGFVLVSACNRLEDRHGYVPAESTLDEVVVGRDTRDTVRVIIGEPGSAGIMDSAGWYYVASNYQRFLFREPVEIDREVLAVSFDESGVVSNIERFGLDDGRVVVLNRRVTDTNIQGITFLQQLFSNFGNFNPGNFIQDG